MTITSFLLIKLFLMGMHGTEFQKKHLFPNEQCTNKNLPRVAYLASFDFSDFSDKPKNC